jgi:lysophospholipase L1-like esterase
MKSKAWLPIAATLFATLPFTGCGAEAAEVPEDDEPSASPEPITAPTSIAEEKPEVWHYVAFGDSTTFVGGEIYYYKEMVEEDLGVKIQLHDWTSGEGGATRLLVRLQSDELVREQLRNADLVTFQIPTHGLEPAMRGFEQGLEVCDEACLAQAHADYKAEAEQIFDAVLALVDPTETIVRAQDTYLVNVTHLKETGTFDIYNRYWWDVQEHIQRLGEERQVPVASVYRVFMGPDGNDDPAEKGWMYDITHANEAGAKVMAQLLRGLGYAYATV